MKKYLTFILLIICLFTGCSGKSGLNKAVSQSEEQLQQVQTNGQPAGIQKESETTEETRRMGVKEPSDQSEAGQDYKWLIQVSDSKNGNIPVPMSDKSLNFKCTLYFVAWKNGGEDIYGTYEGRALITFDIDESKLSDKNVSVTGTAMLDSMMDVNFEILPYDNEEYDRIKKSGTDDISPAPLSTFTGMSAFTGMHEAVKWETVKAIDKKTGKMVLNVNNGSSDSQKYSIGINILVNNEKVTVDIPTYNSTWKLDFFRGSITKNEAGLNPIDIFRDTLITRMEKKQEVSERAKENSKGSDNDPEVPSGTTSSYMTDSEGREGFDTNGDGNLDMWMDENGDMRMDLDQNGQWDPVIESDWGEGALE